MAPVCDCWSYRRPIVLDFTTTARWVDDRLHGMDNPAPITLEYFERNHLVLWLRNSI